VSREAVILSMIGAGLTGAAQAARMDPLTWATRTVQRRLAELIP
jgi:hypothetical protein